MSEHQMKDPLLNPSCWEEDLQTSDTGTLARPRRGRQVLHASEHPILPSPQLEADEEDSLF